MFNYKKNIKVLPRLSVSRPTPRMWIICELARKKKRGSLKKEKRRTAQREGSLNAVGVVGCLQDAGNNVARAAYNSLRIMCITRRWGSAKITIPTGCLLFSQRRTRHTMAKKRNASYCIVYVYVCITCYALICTQCAGLAMGWN